MFKYAFKVTQNELNLLTKISTYSDVLDAEKSIKKNKIDV